MSSAYQISAGSCGDVRIEGSIAEINKKCAIPTIALVECLHTNSPTTVPLNHYMAFGMNKSTDKGLKHDLQQIF